MVEELKSNKVTSAGQANQPYGSPILLGLLRSLCGHALDSFRWQ